MGRTALVFGATGLTGGHLVEELIRNEEYNKVVIFTRREFHTTNPKVHQVTTALDNIEAIADSIKGDDLFCCLGTTIKKAGSQDAFQRVDLNAPSKIALIASANGVKQFVIISSIGADAQSRNFYLRTKGQMEEAVQKSQFSAIAILRPSMIIGKRSEFRTAEEIAKLIYRPVSYLLFGGLRKYRAITAQIIARAMVRIALNPQKDIIFESNKIQSLGS